ncbi:MAG: nucleoside triphosphate hydrolase [Granulosicoccus sp.]|nr:nucleoside triphosphate hydrolase [Granulosicoccus sp.]
MVTAETTDALVRRITDLLAERTQQKRLLIGIAGAPGSGKSTLAEGLCGQLNASSSTEQAVVVPMDGFHLDNVILDRREQRAVKGAPQTFDVDGFIILLQRLGRTTDSSVYVPVFDREADLSRNAAQCVDPEHQIIIVEGNYLLLRRPGWSSLRENFDLTVMLEVPLALLEERLVQRWLDHGHDPAQARQRALSNDIPNARLVLKESTEADLYYKSVR